MQWSTSILMTLFLIQIIVVHSINEKEEEEVDNENMSLELVHRHDSRVIGDVDQLEAIKGSIQRDYFRRQRMNQIKGINQNHRRKDIETQQFQMPMHSGRDYALGEYFVGVKIGSPGQSFWLVADTGSEFTWFNCKPRGKHLGNGGGHKHKHKGESKSKAKTKTKTTTARRKRGASNNPCYGVFCPHRSNTFQQVTCSSHKCKVELSNLFSLSYCPSPSDPCLFDISYADGSSAKGFFGTDTVTVALTNGKKGKLHNLTIGCTQTMLNGVTFNENTGGILGLGYAKDSFVDKASLQYGAKLSYCLVDHLSHQNVSSYLTFGTPKVKLLSEIRKTELFLYSPFYGVHVLGISVGDQMLKIPHQVWDFNAEGGMIIDSGTTLAGLVLEAYDPVFEALKKSLTNVKRLDVGVLDFCFDSEGFNERTVPRLVFHFAGGARFEPPVKSYIIDVEPKVKCIGIVPINGTGASVIGNIMQQDFLWEFDLAKNTVGFASSTCN